MRLRLHDPPRTRRFRGRQAACQAGCGHQDVARRIPRPLRLPRRPEVKINSANGGGKIPAAVFLNGRITPKAKCPFTPRMETVLNLWGENLVWIARGMSGDRKMSLK